MLSTSVTNRTDRSITQEEYVYKQQAHWGDTLTNDRY